MTCFLLHFSSDYNHWLFQFSSLSFGHDDFINHLLFLSIVQDVSGDFLLTFCFCLLQRRKQTVICWWLIAPVLHLHLWSTTFQPFCLMCLTFTLNVILWHEWFVGSWLLLCFCFLILEIEINVFLLNNYLQ